MNEYLVVFEHKDGSATETFHYINKSDADYHFGLFVNDDSDIYRMIALALMDWNAKEETVLRVLSFN